MNLDGIEPSLYLLRALVKKVAYKDVIVNAKTFSVAEALEATAQRVDARARRHRGRTATGSHLRTEQTRT